MERDIKNGEKEPVDFFGKKTGDARRKAVFTPHAVREYRLVTGMA